MNELGVAAGRGEKELVDGSATAKRYHLSDGCVAIKFYKRPRQDEVLFDLGIRRPWGTRTPGRDMRTGDQNSTSTVSLGMMRHRGSVGA